MVEKKIYLIAGEASGDNLGGRLMAAMKELSLEPLTFHGVGGSKMRAQGLASLFPMSDLSLVGFIEIIPHIPKLLKRIRQVLVDVESLKPDVIITLDAPAFNFRVARKLRQRGFKGKLIHYVSPSVWAYKPERVYQMKEWYDHVLALLPIEPHYYEKVHLPCTFVGHPIVEEPFASGDDEAYYKKHRVDPHAQVVVVYPGSRKGELKRHMPVVRDTLELLARQLKNIHVAFISTPENAGYIQNEVNRWRVNMDVHVISDPKEKNDVLMAATIGLVKSGTSTLETALAGVPMVVFYKVNPLSAHMLRKMIQINTVSIINILAKAQVIPEFLQERCEGGLIALEMERLSRSLDAREAQFQKATEILNQLGFKKSPTPSQNAAICVLKELGVKHQTPEEKNLYTPSTYSGLALPSAERKRLEQLLEGGGEMSAANMVQLPGEPKALPSPAKALPAPKPEEKKKKPKAPPADTGSTTEGF
jgi:lipid-A-disaccharide synthase